MKNALVIVPLLIMLSACASGPKPAVGSDDTSAVAAAAEINRRQGTGVQAQDQTARNQTADSRPADGQAQSRAPRREDPLPSADLSEDILYKYLIAEVAEQRGNWQGAYVNMLTIAQQTRDPRIAKRAAEIAVKASQPGEALAAIRLWREFAPYSEEAMQYHLGLIVLSDNLAEAQPILEQHLKETRPNLLGVTFLQTQRLLSRARNKDAAFALLENLSVPYPSVPEARLALAQAAYSKGDVKRAHKEVEQALVLAPDSELTALTLAQISSDKGEAAKSLASFLASNPQSREVRLAYARLLIELKQYDQARAQFKTLLKDNPQDLTTLYALGLLGAQSNDLAEAETYLKKYIALLEAKPDEERDPSQALMLLAQIAEERKDVPGALRWLEQIGPETPQSYLAAQVKRAQLIAKQGDVAGARRVFREYPAEGETEKIQVLTAEAQLLQNLGQSGEAMAVMESGLKRYPNNTDLLYEYAMLAEKLDRLEVMESTLRKVIKLAPKNQHAYNALGYSLADRNMRLQEAHDLIAKALALAPEDPFIMDSMGWVQYRLGKLEEAEKLLRRAYTLRPDPEIAAHLGEVLWVKGQKEDARQLWRDANSKDPKNDTLKSTLARLQVRL